MSRYSDLAHLAAGYSQRYQDHEVECLQFACRFLEGFADYLECPDEKMRSVEIGPGLALGKAGDPVRRSAPAMTYGRDGFWYFGVQVQFDAPDSFNYNLARFLIGLSRSGERFIVRLGRDVEVNPASQEDLSARYECLCEEIREQYSSPASRPPRQFGFRPAQASS